MTKNEKIQWLESVVKHREATIRAQCKLIDSQRERIIVLRRELETELFENIQQFQDQHNQASKRMAHVCRLANAARSHIERGNMAEADALLSPLAQGMHDTYKEVWDETRMC